MDRIKPFHPPLSGAVLVGGDSRRLGADKATTLIAGVRFVDRAVALLKTVCADCMVVGKPLEGLEPGVRNVDDDFVGCGPLGGVAAALRAAHHAEVVVVAVDLVLLTPALLALVCSWNRQAQVAVPAYTRAERTLPAERTLLEPLCARYHVSCRPPIERALRRRQLQVSRIFDCLDVSRIPEAVLRKADPELESFTNINTAADLAQFVAQRGVGKHASFSFWG
jgi:molybdopterin-guanine dinucleotide biosynthesis protein A